MSAAIIAGVVTVGAGVYSANKQRQAQKEAAGAAAEAQTESSQLAIEEQRRQFDAVKELMKPYVDMGIPALSQIEEYGKVGLPALQQIQQYSEVGLPALEKQMAIAGLSGPEAEAAEIERIRGGEKFKQLQEAGEESILQRAAVTGGLRGGRTQGALAQFSPALLNQLIDEEYTRLGGLTGLGLGATGELLSTGLGSTERLASLGQASAAGQAAAGQQMGANVGNLLGDIGSAQAGEAIARGQAQSQYAGQLGSAIGGLAGTFGGLF